MRVWREEGAGRTSPPPLVYQSLVVLPAVFPPWVPVGRVSELCICFTLYPAFTARLCCTYKPTLHALCLPLGAHHCTWLGMPVGAPQGHLAVPLPHPLDVHPAWLLHTPNTHDAAPPPTVAHHHWSSHCRTTDNRVLAREPCSIAIN